MRFLSIIFIIFSLGSKGQINHYAGVGVGYSNLGSVTINYSSYFNVNYTMNYKPFLFTANLSCVPGSDFGICSGGLLSLGFTTPLKYLISAHVTYGIGEYLTNKSSFVAKYDQNNQPLPENTYNYVRDGVSPLLGFGFSIRLGKKSRFLIGIESSLTKIYVEIPAYEQSVNPPYVIYHSTKSDDFNNLSLFLTLSFKLNKPKEIKTEAK
jgi:hypothetical protein